MALVGTISLFEGLVTMKCCSSIFFNLSVAGFTLLNVSAKLTKMIMMDGFSTLFTKET